jgi:serine/threonine-protein kinase
MKSSEPGKSALPKQCPTQQRLSEFVEGGLTLVEHERVESHVDTCDSCHDTILTMDAESETRLGNLIAKNRHGTETGIAKTEQDVKLNALVRSAKQDWREQGIVPTTPIQIGGTIGNYVLLRSLGQGNMGQVVLASHKRMKREVALKFITPELLASPSARTRFQREIEATAKLQHPNLVTAHDAGEANGQHFLVMEYVQGMDLRSKVKQSGPLDVAAAIKCAADAARGLHHAHEKGIVHRDVKPGNIMLGQDQTAKVTDLGLARFADSGPDSVEISQTGLVIGTSAFMSPEQCAGTREIDYRTDIYSLGCTLFYLLTARNVYPADSTLQMLRAHAEEPIPSVRELRPDCPMALEELLNSMLAKRPQDRPESMAIVAAKLDDLLSNLESSPTQVPSSRLATRLPIWPLLAGAITVVLAIYMLGQFSGTLIHKAQTSMGLGANGPTAVKIEMLKIPAGTFMMGASDKDQHASADERPQHKVQLTNDFLLSKFEVTSAQFDAVMGTDKPGNPIRLAEQTQQPSGAVPLSGITWFEAIRFCNQLSIVQGLQPYYEIHEADNTVSIQRGSDGFRLPTEAEWEYACRAGTQTPWYFGDSADNVSDFAWHSENSNGQVQPVGQKKPNAVGLHDMLGNVPEWCWDRFDGEYYLKSEAVNPPGSTKGDQRVFRGGGVSNRPPELRSSSRNPLGMQYGFSNGVGLRIARNIPTSR